MANQIIPLNRLAEILAEKVGISVADAQKFIRQYFETISYGLGSGSDVAIKGLGSFSRSTDRENPLQFTPDESLSQILNAPFEAFVPIPIQGDVDMSETNMPDDETSAETILSDDNTEAQDDSKNSTSIEETITESNDETNILNVARQEDDDEDSSDVVSNNAPEGTEQSTEESEDEPDEPEDFDDDIEGHAEVYVLPHRKRRTFIWCILFMLVGVASGFAVGYYFHDQINAYFCNVKSPSVLPVDADTVKVATDTIKSEPKDTVQEKVVIDTTAKPQPRYDVVTSKQFLTTLAGKYYGVKDYWVYIYEANKSRLKHPDRIKPGTRILIPEITDYLSDPTPTEKNIEQARHKAAQIYARYN